MTVRLDLRLPDDLHAALRDRANAEQRSVVAMARLLIQSGLVQAYPPLVFGASEEMLDGVGWASPNEGALAERESGSAGSRQPEPATVAPTAKQSAVVSRSASVSKTGPAEEGGRAGEASRVASDSGGVGGASKSRNACPMVVPVGVKCKACGKPHTI